MVIKAFGIIIGIFLLFWGFWALHKKSSPVDIVGGICAILGLITALISVLLICVPGFFRTY